jgi:hypothetical protein
MHNQHQTKIPEKFRKYFWDCDFSSLSMKKHSKFIIERILNFGTLNDIQWLRKNVSSSRFREISTKSRRLDKRTRNYWNIIHHHAD